MGFLLLRVYGLTTMIINNGYKRQKNVKILKKILILGNENQVLLVVVVQLQLFCSGYV